jgi:hypothetical protein
VVNALPGLRANLVQTLRWKSEGIPPVDRETLISDRFEATADVGGKSILLIEDTWVTGQTPVSAAISLAEAGAASIVILPIARMVYPETMSPDYATAAQPPFVAGWPK